MPNRDPREMRHRAQKMRALAEEFGDPELKRLLCEQAEKLEKMANDMIQSTSRPPGRSGPSYL